ncbi:hypothetical protein [uncultured Citrobacter sp.]|uniref:hypothetical protein n=1 Tax=uncultured Citrobacter sp. TaxID=200446 RepID=UPI00266BC91F|nr:hypothetical protein [uncultured Citrobacter sp.]
MSFTDIDGVFHPTPCPTKAELLREEIAQRNNAATLADINQRLADAVFPEHRTRSWKVADASGMFSHEYMKPYYVARQKEEAERKERKRLKFLRKLDKEREENALNNAESKR